MEQDNSDILHSPNYYQRLYYELQDECRGGETCQCLIQRAAQALIKLHQEHVEFIGKVETIGRKNSKVIGEVLQMMANDALKKLKEAK
jgi:tRNA uridine 5-carbamoylmethylation protein Kti12